MKTQELTKQEINPEIINNLVLNGDISTMSDSQKTEYYKSFCDSLGLNSLTQPFKILKLGGKLVLYATKDATEQLRKIHGVSITNIDTRELNGVYVVTARATDNKGTSDASTGAVSVGGLKGDALANAIMKAETKAKRRVTLSICGLGILDETETETIPGAVVQDAPAETVVTDQSEEILKDMHLEFMEVLAEFEGLAGPKEAAKYHPDNWSGDKCIKSYRSGTKALREKIQKLQLAEA